VNPVTLETNRVRCHAKGPRLIVFFHAKGPAHPLFATHRMRNDLFTAYITSQSREQPIYSATFMLLVCMCRMTRHSLGIASPCVPNNLGIKLNPDHYILLRSFRQQSLSMWQFKYSVLSGLRVHQEMPQMPANDRPFLAV
jgi:hypothetical protein